MLHVATVHHRSARWIDIQARYLRRYVSVPKQVWTSLQGIDPSFADRFDHVIDQEGGHAGKLNNLAVEISHQADDADLIMFLDGDAFPVADPMPLIEAGLQDASLVAVQRSENLGDEQPHPCFCVTTVGTWRRLPGDWSMGHRWQTPDGRRPTDVGGNLLRTLELTGTAWTPVLRSNPPQLDPLLFAIYGGAIYHHGAGFRRGGASRSHYDSKPKPLSVPDVFLLRMLARRIDRARFHRWKLQTRGLQMIESERMYARIKRDDPDWVKTIS